MLNPLTRHESNQSNDPAAVEINEFEERIPATDVAGYIGKRKSKTQFFLKSQPEL